jgi:hypothetical protein
MYQWITVLLAENLRFQRDIADLYCVPCPRRLKVPIERLVDICNALYTYTMPLYYNFHNSARSEKNKNFFSNHQTMWEVWKEYFEVCIPLVEFIVGKECKHIIKSLKRSAFNEQSYEDSPQLMKQAIDFGSYKTIFNFFEFWDNSENFAKYFEQNQEEEEVTVEPMSRDELMKNRLDGCPPLSNEEMDLAIAYYIRTFHNNGWLTILPCLCWMWNLPKRNFDELMPYIQIILKYKSEYLIRCLG